MNFNGTCRLETPRLILRKFTLNDSQEMFENWASCDEVTKYLTWKAHEDVESTKKFLTSVLKSYDDPKVMNWCIELKELRQVIGSIGTAEINEEMESCEVGYCIGSKWWGRGIMSEALREVIKFLFKKVGMNRIGAYHDIRNFVSGKVMQKCGMRFEGVFREYKKSNSGDKMDVCTYSILRKDLEAMDILKN